MLANTNPSKIRIDHSPAVMSCPAITRKGMEGIEKAFSSLFKVKTRHVTIAISIADFYSKRRDHLRERSPCRRTARTDPLFPAPFCPCHCQAVRCGELVNK